MSGDDREGSSRSVIERYLQCWLDSDRDGARALLADDVTFRSPRESHDGAEAFLASCWEHAARFDAIEILHALYDRHAGYVVYRGDGYVCGELLYVKEGKIASIHVTFDPVA